MWARFFFIVLALILPIAQCFPDRRRRQGNDEDAVKEYIHNLDTMEYEDVLATLDEIMSSSPQEQADQGHNLLNRIRQYEDLKDIVQAFASSLETLPGSEGDIIRPREAVTNEDDWLWSDIPVALALTYNKLHDHGDNDQELLSPRGRLDLGDGRDDAEEEEESINIAKKDLESLIYQANPALTVKQLPEEPQISFRKSYPEKSATHAGEGESASTPRPDFHAGMMEVALLRPAAVKGTNSLPSDEVQLLQLANNEQ